MARCSYEKLTDLEPALEKIRELKDVIEQKPGIFYIKNQAFLHFHEKEDKIWADIKDGKSWGEPIIIPKKITTLFLSKFIKELTRRYHATS